MKKFTDTQKSIISDEIKSVFDHSEYEQFDEPKIVLVTKAGLHREGYYAFAVGIMDYTNSYICVFDGINNWFLSYEKAKPANKSIIKRFQSGLNHGDVKRRFYISDFYKAINNLNK